MNREDTTSFPEALKKLLGRGFLSYPEMLVGLNREGAMTAFPPVQYMMQALPASGFMRPLQMAESVAEIERMSVDFARLTGFHPLCSDYFFKSFAYATGLLTVPPVIPSFPEKNMEKTGAGSGEGEVNEPEESYGNASAVIWDFHWSDEEKCRFLSGLIEVNRENERRLGLRVAAVSCVAAEKYNFRLTAELSRVERDATGAAYYAIYSREGNIADVGALGVMCYDDVSPMPKAVTVPVAPHDVAKILIYWDND